MSRTLITVILGTLLLANGVARATVIYTYDFPTVAGSGSGLAADQANSQPTGATFSDFTRNGGLLVDQKADIFSSENWAIGPGIDTTVYAAFTITADAGYVLELSQLTFDSIRKSSGPTIAEVALFLNGSSTPYAVFDYTPDGTMNPYTFAFTPLTAADNITTATFQFYGGGATSSTGTMAYDNVATHGVITPVPEIPGLYGSLALLPLIWLAHRRRLKRIRTSHSR